VYSDEFACPRTVVASQDAFLAALAEKATDNMIQDGRKMLSYKDISLTVAQVPCLDFLEDVIPRKVTPASLCGGQAKQAHVEPRQADSNAGAAVTRASIPAAANV
jgi:hypothetical protein